MWSKFLLSESTLQVYPSLAKAVGLNEAIVLQQMHFWSDPKKSKGKDSDGFRWVRNSVREWSRDNFPFWGKSTVQRVLKNLVELGLLYSRNDLNEYGYDRTVWYAVNYDRVTELVECYEKDTEFKGSMLPPVPDWDSLSEIGTALSEESPRMGQPVPLWDTPSSQIGTEVQGKPSQIGTTIPNNTNKNDLVTSNQWLQILEVLQMSLTKDVYSAAFNFVSFQGSSETEITLKANNSRAAEWINKRLQDQILTATRNVIGEEAGVVKVWARV